MCDVSVGHECVGVGDEQVETLDNSRIGFDGSSGGGWFHGYKGCPEAGSDATRPARNWGELAVKPLDEPRRWRRNQIKKPVMARSEGAKPPKK